MRILLTGARGFIGRHLRQALLDAGHTLRCTSREYRPDAIRCQWVVVDFAQVSTTRWRELLADVDAVVNTVGVPRERGDATFAAVHATAVRRLFVACVHAGVRRVVHVSTLAADRHSRSAHHLSTRAAEAHLLSLPLDATVVQLSLVFGLDSAASRALLSWASLPLVPLPAGGLQPVQPVHVSDVTDALVALMLARDLTRGQCIALIGPTPLTLREYLRALRFGLGLSSWRECTVPASWLRFALRVAEKWPGARLHPNAWPVLEWGAVADAAAWVALLGRAPRAASQFIEPGGATAIRRQAQFGWLLPRMGRQQAAIPAGAARSRPDQQQPTDAA